MRWTAQLVVVFLLGASASSTANELTARAHFKKGTALYALEDYDGAIREFEAGFKEAPEPGFLYNIARAHLLAGRAEKALRFFRRYLELAPGAKDRGEIEAQIATLERQLPPPTSEPPPVAEPPRARAFTAAPLTPPTVQAAVPHAAAAPPIYRRWPLWVGVAGGVVVVGAIAVAATVASSHPSEPVWPAVNAR